MFVVALFAPWIAPHDPSRIDIKNILVGPTDQHPFGTDELGRDLFVRLCAGGRVSLTIGFCTMLLSIFIGTMIGVPIINQPQVAILGIGGIEKRPVVVDDAIAIRSMMYLSMSYDHRVVDGAVADQFLALVKKGLQEFDESLL